MPFPKEMLSQDEKVALDLRPTGGTSHQRRAYLAVAAIVGIIRSRSGPATTPAWDVLKFLVGIGVLMALGNFAHALRQVVDTPTSWSPTSE